MYVLLGAIKKFNIDKNIHDYVSPASMVMVSSQALFRKVF